MKKIKEYFEEIETEEAYDGYYYEIGEQVSIVVLGSLCGLKNVSQIHQWASSEAVGKYLKEEMGIERIPCYYWFLCLLKLVKPASLNECLMRWAEEMLPETREGLTVAVDGKTIRSTEKMEKYKQPLHIVSAQLSELGVTFGSRSVDGKSNEIPAVQKLLKELDLSGCMVVADALNCQKKTAQAVVDGKGDYLLSVKKNQGNLKKDISDYVQDPELQAGMDKHVTKEKNRGRIETRTAFTTDDISWLYGKEEWPQLRCIGAIHTQFEEKGKKSSEWHYYISSRPLCAKELLHHARMEWGVESMHWLLDVHFDEDFCRIQNKTIQENLNMLRKFALSIMKVYKKSTASKQPLSHIMLQCLLDPLSITSVLSHAGKA